MPQSCIKNVFKIANRWNLSISQTRVWGQNPKMGTFCDISEKNSHFNVIQIKFRIFLEQLKKLNKYNLKAI